MSIRCQRWLKRTSTRTSIQPALKVEAFFTRFTIELSFTDKLDGNETHFRFKGDVLLHLVLQSEGLQREEGSNTSNNV